MTRGLPQEVDTLIIGNGPSALILSYILHGHIPIYDLANPHPDPILHEKLKNSRDLLDVDIDHLTEHFLASRFSYSTQALPVNVLFDTLLRPYGETEGNASCVKWKFDPSRAVPHVVMGNTCRPGGQWVDNPVEANGDIGTLSYAGMLSLPGYGFDQHYKNVNGKELPFYLRPSRRQVADYLAAYPARVGIDDSIHNGMRLAGGSRCPGGFHFASHGVTCKHLVLASGIFSKLIPARPLLQPLARLSSLPTVPEEYPILVIGSGFSAADVIISTPANQKIIHIFKWDPAKAPSPLRACHQEAYPEYAGVYRRMKLTALASSTSRDRKARPMRRGSSAFDLSRDWTSNYEGLPNTEIIQLRMTDSSAVITLRNDAHDVFEREISRLFYVVGRRGSLKYLDRDLQCEIGIGENEADLLSAHTLRQAASEDLQIVPGMFVIGSLTGDSLVRFAYGSCTYAAGKIMGSRLKFWQQSQTVKVNGFARQHTRASHVSPSISPMNGLDGHSSNPHAQGHNQRPLDRRKESDHTRGPLIEIRESFS